jgi:hypothetical protein
MHDLLREVERFRSWAAKYLLTERNAEWEVNYADWDRLYAAVSVFIQERPVNSWSAAEMSAILYVIARDNECESLSDEFGDDLLLDLTEASLATEEVDAKWQFAAQLCRVKTDIERRERLLQILAQDENEYVRRRALQSLARTESPVTEEYALDAWRRPDESQEWARMNALWALHRIKSPRLAPLWAEAEQDERQHLSEYAARVRNGEIDP